MYVHTIHMNTVLNDFMYVHMYIYCHFSVKATGVISIGIKLGLF